MARGLRDLSMGLVQVWATDGTIWLLPAYVFTDAQGAKYPVLAVDSSYLDLPGASGSTGPAVGSTGSGGGSTDPGAPATAVVQTAMVDSGPKPIN